MITHMKKSVMGVNALKDFKYFSWHFACMVLIDMILWYDQLYVAFCNDVQAVTEERGNRFLYLDKR